MGSLIDGMLSSKSWFFICSHRRWSDLLSRRCLRDHSHQTLEKETLRHTPQKNHLVAPAVSTDDDPVIQEGAHRRLGQEEKQALGLATEEER